MCHGFGRGYHEPMAKTVLFGRYRLLEPAGSGGSAEVWRALDTKTGDEVAVKRLHPIVFADENGRARLKREFAALRSLDEAHIVRVRDLRIAKNEAAIILDYVPGQSLADRLAGGPPFQPAEAVAVARDIAAALTAAHAAGIIHRDVTPGNILLDPTDGARLTDFGIALGGGAESVTATGQLMGTMRFLAPEQLRGAPATPASDLHSLAAVTYEMLAGRPAYSATTPVALAEAQDLGAAPIDTIPAALDAAVRQAMAPEPADRPADVGTFAEQLSAGLIADAVTQRIDLRAAGIAAPPKEIAPMPIAAAAEAEPLPEVEPAAVPPTTGESADASAPEKTPSPLTGAPSGRSIAPPLAVLLALIFAGIIFAALSPQDRRPSSVGASPPIAGPTSPGLTQPSAQPSPSSSPTASMAAKPAKGHGHKEKHH
jgi:serine/threonine protein kinase